MVMKEKLEHLLIFTNSCSCRWSQSKINKNSSPWLSLKLLLKLTHYIYVFYSYLYFWVFMFFYSDISQRSIILQLYCLVFVDLPFRNLMMGLSHIRLISPICISTQSWFSSCVVCCKTLLQDDFLLLIYKLNNHYRKLLLFALVL